MQIFSRYILAALLLYPMTGEAIRADDGILLSDTFADHDYSQNPVWKSLRAGEPWTVTSGAVGPGGNVIFDTLETQDFEQIADGAFDLCMKVRFESRLQDGNNRLFLRMRDSKSNRDGYEVVISQGTSNNVLLGEIGGAAISQKLKTAPFNFPPDDFVQIRWARDTHGTMKVWVGGDEYIDGTDTAFQKFDVLEVGSRSFISEGANPPSGMRHFFSDIKLRKGPESLSDMKD